MNCKHDLYLNELLARRASSRTCVQCHQDGAYWRCVDCFTGPAYCTECCRKLHSRDPFHRIERWTGTYYEPSWLWKVGLVLHLGHGGGRCPQALIEQPDLDLELDEESWCDLDDMSGPADDTKPSESVHNGGRVMTVIHTSGVHHMPVIFCGCPGAPMEDLQLFRIGLYPATYKRCQTVFTFQLLDDYLLDNLECKTSATHYFSKLRRITNFAFPHSIPVGMFIY